MTHAVGFGGINVTSSLGQPLVAEIELVAVDKADKSSLNAKLATPDAFKGAGIDYPYALPKLKFKIETRANGDSFIKASSDQPVNEPFVSLLIELSWSSGRLLREYTFLLDPPGFVAEQPVVAAIKPIEPVIVSPLAASASVAVSAPQIAEPAPVAVAPISSPAPAPQSTPAEPPVQREAIKTEELPPAETKGGATKQVHKKTLDVSLVAGPITVKRGDTLSKIANQTKSPEVSLERMLVALYRANAEAFDGNNMNRLRTGKILRLPESEELAKLQQREAVKEVHAQVVDWNAYRQKLAAVNASATDHHPKQEAAGKITTAIAEKSATTKEPSKEVLKLSKGEAPGDKAAAGGKDKSSKEKAIAKEEEHIAKAKAIKEAEQRTALLEKSVKDMQRLVELKNQASAKAEQEKMAASSAPAAVLPMSVSAVTPASAVATASAVAKASAVVASKPKVAAPKVVAPSPSEDMMENPLYLAGGAAALLGLGGLGLVMLRRKKTATTKDTVNSVEDVGGATGRIAAPVAPSPETGDFTHTVVASPAVVADVDEVDPIGEADLFLNFGRDVQAEEVLKEALNKDPANNPIKLKLLSIYASRKDVKSFYVYALEIKDSGDSPAWEQAAAMGRELDPSNSVYGGSAETGGATSTSEAPVAESAMPVVDFDLGFGSSEEVVPAVDIEMTPASHSPVGEGTVILSASELRAAQEAPMDFDVTGTHPGVKTAEAASPKIEANAEETVPAMDFAMDFGFQEAASETPQVATTEEPKLEVAAMDFDLTGSIPGITSSVAQESAEQTPALNLDDLVFDVTSSHAPVIKATPSQTPVVPEPVMAFTIDFPVEAKLEPATASTKSSAALGEINLNLGDLATPTTTAAEIKDEHWQEVATKLDLAKAYQEMGDQAGAKEILEEVLKEGDASQREAAETLLQQLS